MEEGNMVISRVINETSNRISRDWDPPSWRALYIAFPWMIGLVFSLYCIVRNEAVAVRERTTYGIIRKHEPANHNSFGYEFSVNGKIYTGWQIPATEYEIGQSVLVYYDPHDPTTSSLYSFSEGNFGPPIFCFVGITVVAVVIFALRRDHAQRSRSNNIQ
ncbi:MAG: DUF3592 domain-containing protein [Terracidiphilus sp.]